MQHHATSYNKCCTKWAYGAESVSSDSRLTSFEFNNQLFFNISSCVFESLKLPNVDPYLHLDRPKFKATVGFSRDFSPQCLVSLTTDRCGFLWSSSQRILAFIS